jgi:hypothetical protein
MFEEIIAVYGKNHTKPINTKYRTALQIVMIAGAYNYH